jgi:hypothetical protein
VIAGAVTTDDDDFIGGSGSRAVPAVVAGDVSSVTTTTTGTSTKTVVYTLKIKVPSTAGTVNGVRVAAAIFDESRSFGQEWTVIVLSPANLTLNIDADRPSSLGFPGFVNGPSPAVGDVRSVAGQGVLVKGVSAKVGVPDVEVLGIGDRIEIDYDLGFYAADVILDRSLRVVARFLGKTIELSVDTGTGTFTYTIQEGDFGDLTFVNESQFIFSLFLIDQAGNLGDADSDAVNPLGVSQTVGFLVDATKPDVETVGGDILSLADGDFLTCGMKNAFADGYASTGDAPNWLIRQDLNALTYQFAEGLDKLKIDFAGPKNLSLTIDPVDAHFLDGTGGNDLSKNVFAKDVKRAIDFTNLVKAFDPAPTAAVDDLSIGFVRPDAIAKDSTPICAILADQKLDMANVLTDQVTLTGDDVLTGLVDGIYSISFTPSDLAGNVGVAKTFSNISVDVTKPSFGARLFPIGSALTTINAETARVHLQFNEPMAHAEIVYIPIDAAGNPVAGGKTRRRVLTGSELIKTTEQVVAVDSLEDNVGYRVYIVAQDLKGKINRSIVSNFLYDVEFVNAVADRFVVSVTDGLADPLFVGMEVQVTIAAQDATNEDDNDADRDPVLPAYTYNADGVLLIVAGGDVELVPDKNVGVTPVEGQSGHFILDQSGWNAGAFSLTFIGTSGANPLTITVSDPGAVISGTLAEPIVIQPYVINFDLIADWDMVSLPLLVVDPALKTLFPLGSSLFGHVTNQGYILEDAFVCGKGYWLKPNGVVDKTVEGRQCPVDPLDLPAGWSMIGPPNSTINVGCVDAAAGGNLLSLFGYTPGGGYQAVVTMEPSQAYWAKLNAPGMLALGDCLAKPTAPIAAESQSPPLLWAQSGRGRQAIRLQAENEPLREMPPLPPAGVLDMRLENEGQWTRQIAADAEQKEYRLRIQGQAVQLGWDDLGLNARPWELVIGSTIYPLVGSRTVSLDTEVAELVLRRTAKGVPTDFALRQNYPNPFNPSTTIGYSLPVGDNISLKIYDMIGQQIEELVGQWQDAGEYQLVWDGTDALGRVVGNGLYFYELRAGNYRALNKMILLK